jgi:hypothetical protein
MVRVQGQHVIEVADRGGEVRRHGGAHLLGVDLPWFPFGGPPPLASQPPS